MMKFTGVDGVTVARGAIGNPWVFEQARALAEGLPVVYPSLHEQRRVIAEHLRLSVEKYGPEKACRHMRKFGIRYSELHPEFLSLRDTFIKVKTPADWEAVLNQWYAIDRPGCPPPVEEPNPVCATR